MEAHLMNLIRCAVYLITVSLALLLMVRAADNNLMRRVTVLSAVAEIYWNRQIGALLYLLLGALLETVVAVTGVLFLLALLVALVCLPLVGLIRQLIH